MSSLRVSSPGDLSVLLESEKENEKWKWWKWFRLVGGISNNEHFLSEESHWNVDAALISTV